MHGGGTALLLLQVGTPLQQPMGGQRDSSSNKHVDVCASNSSSIIKEDFSTLLVVVLILILADLLFISILQCATPLFARFQKKINFFFLKL